MMNEEYSCKNRWWYIGGNGYGIQTNGEGNSMLVLYQHGMQNIFHNLRSSRFKIRIFKPKSEFFMTFLQN